MTSHVQQPTALATIRREHNAIGAVLDVMQHEVEAGAKGRGLDLSLMDQILTYLVTFSGVIHHPKEERFLHAILRQRAPHLMSTLTHVEAEHAKGALMLQELRASLSDNTTFGRRAADYAAFEMAHMSREESELLPAAMQYLRPADWAELDAAFSDSDEPLLGPKPVVRFAALRDRILKTHDQARA